MSPGKGIWLCKPRAEEQRWAVWFGCKCASKYCVTFQPGPFACSLHSFNISDCRRGSASLLIFGIYSHPLRFLFHVGCEMLQHVHHLKHVWIVFVIRFLFNLCHTACMPHTGWPGYPVCVLDLIRGSLLCSPRRKKLVYFIVFPKNLSIYICVFDLMYS